MSPASANHRAFTLIELLVVIGIIGILLALLIPVVRGARSQSDSTACASNLRQLYLAQMFYADENAGKLATPMVNDAGDARWDTKLEKYVNRNATETAVGIYRIACPSVTADEIGVGRLTYGVNTHLRMPNWKLKRAAKYSTSEIILMGDMPASSYDFLVSHDRFFLQVNADMPAWMDSVNHRSDRAYRHAKGTRANMLMADGHVRLMSGKELYRDAGHWYWGKWEIDQMEYYDGCCE